MKNLVLLMAVAVFFSCTQKKEKSSEETVVEEVVEQEETSKSEGEVTEAVKAEAKTSDSVEIVEVVEESEKIDTEEESEKSIETKKEQVTSKQSTTQQSQAIEEKVEKEVAEEKQVEEVKVIRPDHTVWDQLTKTYITTSGNVNYDGLSSKRSEISAYIDQLKNLAPQNDWSKNEKLAYWINLYNALTVNLILENYPLKSIMEINGGKAWDLKVVTVAGKEYSLNDIEHGTIRKQFKEPRIHFAVNCAAKSCPKLLNGAFLPNQLNAQLEKQTKYFVNNESKNQISSDATKLSKIFEWYASDFGDIKNYIQKYSTSFNPNAPISYVEYEWDLNK